MKKKVWFWFTLVEMLIVIVIIGILGAAILPKLWWYLERTRDLKRQTDLRTISTAIIAYRNSHWKFPLRDMPEKEKQNKERMTPSKINGKYLPPSHWVLWEFYWTVSWLAQKLSSYIKQLPKDPLWWNKVCITWNCFTHFTSKTYSVRAHPLWKAEQEVAVVPWEYMYRLQWDKLWAMLIAKTETADASNYVIIDTDFNHRNDFNGAAINYWWFDVVAKLNKLKLCTSIKRGNPWEEKFEVKNDGHVDCIYSHPEQLYYIVKIE